MVTTLISAILITTREAYIVFYSYNYRLYTVTCQYFSPHPGLTIGVTITE